jgi:hypothetical protein
MDPFQTRVENKLDGIKVELTGIQVTLARQEENLRAHMRRSDANEAAVEMMREEFSAHQRLFAQHLGRVNLVLALIGSLAAAVLAGIVRFLAIRG